MGWTTRRPKVLVLEDQPSEARMLMRILEAEGYDVETVDTAEEALGRLAVCHYCPYDLLVLDLRMPGLNGCHVVKFIVNHRRDLLDRILVSSSATPRDHPELIGTHSIQLPWLRKPYSPQDLIEKANEIVASVPPPAPAWLSFR